MSSTRKFSFNLRFILAFGLLYLGCFQCCLKAQDTVRICAGVVTTFTANSPGGVLYQWDFDGDGNIDATGTPGTFSYSILDTFPSYLLLTDANSCVNSDTVQVIVIRTLINGFNVVPSTCANNGNGQATVFTSGGSGALSYLWSNGQTSQTATGLAPGTYSVTVSDTLGCDATGTVTLPALPAFGADAGPNAYVIINSGSGPDPQPSVTLQGIANGGVPPFTYSWTPVVNLNTPTNSSTVASPTTTLVYTLTITDANGCTATDTVRVQVIDINSSDSLPIVGNNPNKIYVCHNGTTIQVNANAPCNNQNSLCYHLNHGDPLGPCVPKTDAESIAEGTEAQSGSFESKPWAMAYPNPFREQTTIRFNFPGEEDYSLRIIDISGQSVIEVEAGIAVAGQTVETTVPTEKLSAGVYFAQLTTESGILVVVKLVKE